MYKYLGLGAPKTMFMRLLMADYTTKRLVGNLKNILLKVASIIFSTDIVILECEVNFKPYNLDPL